MSKSSTFSNDILKLIFNGTAIAGIADNAASNPLTDLYLALHTNDPGELGDQTTHEVAYESYARVAVTRSGSGWAVSANGVSPVNVVEFPESTGGGPGVATHVSIGTAPNGSGKILYRGAITPVISYDVGVKPNIKATSVITED